MGCLQGPDQQKRRSACTSSFLPCCPSSQLAWRATSRNPSPGTSRAAWKGAFNGPAAAQTAFVMGPGDGGHEAERDRVAGTQGHGSARRAVGKDCGSS